MTNLLSLRYYEDSSYEDYDYSADGWYQDENGEWVQDTSLVQNNQQQTKLANGDVLPAATVTAESAEAAKEASKQVISRYVPLMRINSFPRASSKLDVA